MQTQLARFSVEKDSGVTHLAMRNPTVLAGLSPPAPCRWHRLLFNPLYIIKATERKYGQLYILLVE